MAFPSACPRPQVNTPTFPRGRPPNVASQRPLVPACEASSSEWHEDGSPQTAACSTQGDFWRKSFAIKPRQMQKQPDHALILMRASSQSRFVTHLPYNRQYQCQVLRACSSPEMPLLRGSTCLLQHHVIFQIKACAVAADRTRRNKRVEALVEA